MFDFEKLEVYQEIRSLNKKLLPLIFKFQNKEPYLADQLKRAGLSVQLNLAEGTGRMTDADKKRFYIMSRSSVNECVSILQSIVDIEITGSHAGSFQRQLPDLARTKGTVILIDDSGIDVKIGPANAAGFTNGVFRRKGEQAGTKLGHAEPLFETESFLASALFDQRHGERRAATGAKA